MNLLKILDTLSDDQFFTKFANRQTGAQKQTGAGLNTAEPTVVYAAAGASTAVTASAASALTDALQLALTLEYLEDEYYRVGLATSGLIPSADRIVFQQISKHETAHVGFLKSTLMSLGVSPGPKPTFDFTAGGNFQPFTDYAQFMTLAQAFEDTGVRAYKGQAGNVASNKNVLQAALQIHSVEARHASQVRRMRGNKGWVELNNGGNIPAAAQAVYNGEEATVQAGFNTATLFGAAAGSASFDETLSGDDAAMIAGLFIA